MSFNSYKLSATSITLDTGSFDYSYARTPPIGDISTKIATTEFISNGYLPLTGGTVTGTINISPSGSIVINNSRGFILNNQSTLPTTGFDTITLSQNGITRWEFGKNNGSETGNNLGSDFYINTFKDDGSYNNTALYISRSSGQVQIYEGLSIPTPPVDDNSSSAANTQWVNQQDYVKGDLDITPSNGDKIGLGLYYQGASKLPCFIYNDGTNNIFVDLATSDFTNGKYLPLVGGTLSGQLNINADLDVSGNIYATGNLSLSGSGSTISAARGAINYTPSVGDQSINIANTQFVYNSLQNYVSGILALNASDHQGLGFHFSNDGTPVGVYKDSSGNMQYPVLATQAWTGQNYLALSGGTVGWLNTNGDINVNGSLYSRNNISASNSISAVSGTLSYNINAGDSSNNIANTKFVTSAISQEITNRNNAISIESQARANADAGKYDKTGGQISGNTNITGSLQVNGNINSNSTISGGTLQSNFATVINTPGTSDSSQNVANTQWVHNLLNNSGLATQDFVRGTFSTSSAIESFGYQIFPSGLIFQWGGGHLSGDNLTLPITFPNRFLWIYATNTDWQGRFSDNAWATPVTTSTFSIGTKGSGGGETPYSGYAVAYLAIGY